MVMYKIDRGGPKIIHWEINLSFINKSDLWFEKKKLQFFVDILTIGSGSKYCKKCPFT